MAAYNEQQLEQLWIEAGGKAALAPLMAAIAIAESGGNPNAHNTSGAAGLWQILGQPFPGNVYNPLTNAKMAVAKYNSQGLGAWATYTSGAYKQYLPPATTVNNSTGIGPLDDVANAIGAPFNAAGAVVGDAIGTTGQLIGLITSLQFWIRVGECIAGLILLVLGLRSLAGNDDNPIRAIGGAARRAGEVALA